MRELFFDVDIGDEGKRLDRFLYDSLENEGELSVSRSYLQSLIEKGSSTVGLTQAQKSYRVKKGDIVRLCFEEPKPLEAAPQNIPLSIVYEDDCLLVVNKPKGMVVHPAPGNPDNTLVNALLYHCEGRLSGINGVLRPGIVHRIDKDTSGLLVVAKNDMAHRALSEQIAKHSVKRRYFTVVHGRIDGPVTIEKPIGRSEKDRLKYCVTDKNSKYACTYCEPLRYFKGFTYAACSLKTGRTHQIRVHLSYIGHPVAGDAVYGIKNTNGLSGQCLHAGVLGFNHPVTGEYIEFEAGLPDYFTEFLNSLQEE